MILSDLVHVPIGISLGFIASVLTASVLASLLAPRRMDKSDSETRIAVE
jgi:hypothetical protein